jgi:hypothetical protein
VEDARSNAGIFGSKVLLLLLASSGKVYVILYKSLVVKGRKEMLGWK